MAKLFDSAVEIPFRVVPDPVFKKFMKVGPEMETKSLVADQESDTMCNSLDSRIGPELASDLQKSLLDYVSRMACLLIPGLEQLTSENRERIQDLDGASQSALKFFLQGPQTPLLIVYSREHIISSKFECQGKLARHEKKHLPSKADY